MYRKSGIAQLCRSRIPANVHNLYRPAPGRAAAH
jgi:hypothetical protein